MITTINEYNKIDPHMFDDYIGKFFIIINHYHGSEGFNLKYIKSIEYRTGWFYIYALTTPFKNTTTVANKYLDVTHMQLRRNDIKELDIKTITPEKLLTEYFDIFKAYYYNIKYLLSNYKGEWHKLQHNKNHKYMFDILNSIKDVDVYMNADKYNI